MSIKEKIGFRTFDKLKWRDARTDLANLGKAQKLLTISSGISPAVANLRTRSLRKYLEWRQAAIFTYLAAETHSLGVTAYAMCESEDYDFVMQWIRDGIRHYTPVQLKEVVPKKVNSMASLEGVLAGLCKYQVPTDTIVAIHFNQTRRIVFDEIIAPSTKMKEVWLYGALDAAQTRWYLFGDLLQKPRLFEVDFAR